ncbi:MAG: DUF420 domain-containing protein [Deltaproteobacteria bacterium]|nr:DUF420 domain-containing protein [Deltaproteobacteria bacterium]
MMDLPWHPTLNAALNGLSALFLAAGAVSIRNKRESIHRMFMVSAFFCSTVFLASYLAYHATHLATPFTHPGGVRVVYFTILISHILLAVIMVPMILITLGRAVKDNRPAHKAIAHWTLPIWFYVSVTGVVIYLMLYVLYPAQSVPTV